MPRKYPARSKPGRSTPFVATRASMAAPAPDSTTGQHSRREEPTERSPDILPEDDRYRQTAFDGGVGIAVGSSASVRAGLRYSDGNGRVVGPVTYGARDTGTASQTRDLTVYGTVSHTMGSRFTGNGTINYFRYRGRFADTISDPFSTYAILTGTPNALYPNGTRLVRLIDAAEFDTLVSGWCAARPWTVPGVGTEF